MDPHRAASAPSERPVAMARRGGGTARPYPRPTRPRSIRVGVERQLVGRGSSSSRSDVVSARRGRTFLRRGTSRGGGRTRGGARGVSSSRTSRGARASTGPRRGTRGRVGSGVPPEDPGLRSRAPPGRSPPEGDARRRGESGHRGRDDDGGAVSVAERRRGGRRTPTKGGGGGCRGSRRGGSRHRRRRRGGSRRGESISRESRGESRGDRDVPASG